MTEEERQSIIDEIKEQLLADMVDITKLPKGDATDGASLPVLQHSELVIQELNNFIGVYDIDVERQSADSDIVNIYLKNAAGVVIKTIVTNAATLEQVNTKVAKINESLTLISSSLSAKQDKLVSGTNIKTINGESILGSGDVSLEPIREQIERNTNDIDVNTDRLNIEGTQVITVDEMINFNPIANEGGSYLVGYLDKPSRYVVTKEVGEVPVNVGILEILSDSSQYIYTQVFTTHFVLDNSGNLDLGSHSDTKLFTYFRSYSIDSPLIDSGTWTKWEDISHYNDIQKNIAENRQDIEFLNTNTGIPEYPVFDEATAYAVGDVVLFEGLMYRFTSAHEAGAWNGAQVEDWSERKEREETLKQLSSDFMYYGDVFSIPNTYVSNEGFIVTDSTGTFCTTPYMSLKWVKTILISKAFSNKYLKTAAFYDGNKKYISGISSSQTDAGEVVSLTINSQDIPTKAAYIVLTALSTTANKSVKILLSDVLDSIHEEIESTNKTVTNTTELGLTMKALLFEESKKVYEVQGEVEYYRQYDTGFTQYVSGCQTALFDNGILFNKIVVFAKANEDSTCQYLICKSKVNFNTPANRTVLHSGEIALSSSFGSCEILLPQPKYLDAGEKLAVLFYNKTGIKTTVLGSPSSADIYYGTPQPVIFGLKPISDNLDNATLHQGVVNATENRGYIGVQPILEFTTFKSDIELLKSEIKNVGKTDIDIVLPNNIYAVVGDTLQLFYRGMIKVVNPYNYNILISCVKGKQYPRYFEFIPTASDVGNTLFKITVKDNNRNIIAEKTCTIIVNSVATSPSVPKMVACFGDSLTSGGTWCAEAYRRMVREDGSPVGHGLSNISFIGSKNSSGAGYFGVGGWSWSSYTTKGVSAYRFQVDNVSSLSVGAKYTHNENEFTIMEVNVTSGTGNILCSVDSLTPIPTSSGVLTKKSGSGDGVISFTSYSQDSANPLWDYAQNKMTFIQYANKYANGNLDYVYTLLSWNGLSNGQTDFSSILAQVKIFADTLHAEYPNCKLKIIGLQVPSVNGGMGANYGATGNSYADGYGMVVTALNLNKAYQEFADSEGYKTFVEYVDIASQFDSENNMPSADAPVNSRSTITEKRGTNGIHPTIEGYMQIADVVYRNLMNELK